MSIDYAAIAPEIALTITAIVVLLADLFLKGDGKRLVNPIATVGTIVTIVLTAALWGETRSTFGGMFVVDAYAVVFKMMFLLTLGAILAVGYRYFAEGRFFQGEYYFLLLVSFLGMIVMPSARDLVVLFVAIETVSIPAFVMAGLRKRDLYSSEAAIKFFLIGVLSVAISLFGMSMIYGFTGTTSLTGIADVLRSTSNPEPLLLGSLLLVIVGFGFKVSAVPFHFWAPDTYAGSPLPVTAMLAVASKAAGFAGLLAVTFIAFEPYASIWAPALGVLAVLTMTIGNLTALQQRDIVRLLAYSSIGQAGYMLVPFGIAQAGNATLNTQAIESVLFYLIAYAIMNVGAFGVVIAVYRKGGDRSLNDYAGLGYRSPIMAIAMTGFLLSLGGAVPMVGFWAKWFVFVASVQAATTFGYALAIFVVLNAVIAMFYYLRVAWIMWMREPREGAPALTPGFILASAVTVLMLVSLVLGLLPGIVTQYSSAIEIAAR